MPAQWTPQLIILTLVLVFGMVMSFTFFMISFHRWNHRPTQGSVTETSIVDLTLLRAMRLEFGFFACQFARFIHTFHELHQSSQSQIYRTDNWAVFERSFVTLVLVVLSVLDYRDAGRLKRLLGTIAIRLFNR